MTNIPNIYAHINYRSSKNLVGLRFIWLLATPWSLSQCHSTAWVGPFSLSTAYLPISWDPITPTAFRPYRPDSTVTQTLTRLRYPGAASFRLTLSISESLLSRNQRGVKTNHHFFFSHPQNTHNTHQYFVLIVEENPTVVLFFHEYF